MERTSTQTRNLLQKILLLSCVILIFSVLVKKLFFTQQSIRDNCCVLPLHLPNNPEFSFDNYGYEEAVKELKPLAEFKGDYPEVRDAQRILLDYKKKEERRLDAYKAYYQYKEEKLWLQAFEALQEVNVLTPEKRRTEREKLDAEFREIQPFTTQYQSELQPWRTELDTYRQNIQDFYRKRSQDPQNLLKVEENIQQIFKMTIPKIIDSKFTIEELNASKEFAEKMQENVQKRRYELFEAERRPFIVFLHKIQIALEFLISKKDDEIPQELFLGTLPLGSLKQFENAIEQTNEPIVQLYFLEKARSHTEKIVVLLEQIKKLPDFDEKADKEKFWDLEKRFLAIQSQIKAKFEQKNQEYEENLLRMKAFKNE